MLRYTTVLILGVVVGDALGDVFNAWIWLAMMSLLTGAAYFFNKSRGLLSSICVLAAVLCVGGFRVCYSRLGANDISLGKGKNAFEVNNAKADCELIVLSEPKEHGKVLQFDCLVYDSEDREISGWKMRASMLRDEYTGNYKTVKMGDALKAQVDITPLHDWHRQNSHFNYMRWLRSRNFRCNAFIPINKWEHVETDWSKIGTGDEIQIRALMLRDKVLKRFAVNMDGETYAIATAMTLGNKGALTPEMYEEYNMSGASHVLALSGLHLSIVFMLFAYVLKLNRLWKRMVLLAFVWTYVFFVGLPISMIRAATMLTLWEGIKALAYDQKPLNVLGMAGFIMIMINPTCLWDVGFEMSFMAILSILVFSGVSQRCMPDVLKHKSKKEEKRLPGWWKWWRVPLGVLVQTVTISVSAQIGTMPLTVYYFGRIPMYFLLSSVFVLVFAMVIVCLTLVMVILALFDIALGIDGGMGSYLMGRMVVVFVCGFNYCIQWVAHLPGASIEGVVINEVQVLAMYGVVVVLALWANRGRAN